MKLKICFTVQICLIFILSFAGCGPNQVANIKVSDPKVSIHISDDGLLQAEDLLIPADAKIYFQFFLDIPEEMEIMLEFRWYRAGELYYSYLGTHTRGDTTATLERNSSVLEKFP